MANVIKQNPKIGAILQAYQQGDYQGLLDSQQALQLLADSTGVSVDVIVTTVTNELNKKGTTDNNITAIDITEGNKKDVLTTLGHEVIGHNLGGENETLADLSGTVTKLLVSAGMDAVQDDIDTHKATLNDGIDIKTQQAENQTLLEANNELLLEEMVDNDDEFMDKGLNRPNIIQVMFPAHTAFLTDDPIGGSAQAQLEYANMTNLKRGAAVVGGYTAVSPYVVGSGIQLTGVASSEINAAIHSLRLQAQASRLTYQQTLQKIDSIGKFMIEKGRTYEETFKIVSKMRTQLKYNTRRESGKVLKTTANMFDKFRTGNMGKKFNEAEKFERIATKMREKLGRKPTREEVYKKMLESINKSNNHIDKLNRVSK